MEQLHAGNFIPDAEFWNQLLIFRNFCVTDGYIFRQLFGGEPADYRYAFAYIDSRLDDYLRHREERLRD